MNAIPTLTPLAMPCNSSFEAKDWEIFRAIGIRLRVFKMSLLQLNESSY